VVTIILEPSSPDYKRWHDLVLLTLRRYALDNHVLSDVAYPSVYWARLDNIVVTWILGTLSPELHEIIWEMTETARQASLTIKAQFLDNNESRVLQLDARFRAFKQGDLSISDYYRRMKGMADDLRAFSETVTDYHLILNLLQGPNKWFDHMKSDMFGLSMNDLYTWNMIARCNSSGPLYMMCLPLHPVPSTLVASAST
jgi:hypothetical protein